MMQQSILRAEHINAYYKDYKKMGSRRQVLFDVSFEIGKGEVLGLVGESGSGKSTLAKTILGIHKDTEGTIEKQSEAVSMVFQDPYGSLNPARRIGWILQEPLRIKGGLSKTEMERRAKEMLCRVGLSEDFMERYPRQLSGGQRQRVCIGVALMQEPALLIADEPVSALDVTIQAQVIDLMKKLQKEMELSILFISHDLRVVYRMCDRVMIMKEGRIVESGMPEEVYFAPKAEYTRTLLKAAGI
ncbi:MAG: ABC transporter ATP-binding protein [Lachnospiraceae bacterium]